MISRREAADAYATATALAIADRDANIETVIALLELAVAGGHAEAANALATWCYFGIGMRRDYVRGNQLAMLADRAGIAEATYNLGYSHESGKGVGKDLKKAVAYYRRAAQRGDERAMFELSRCLYFGIGTRKNESLGLRWQERSGLDD
jgi:uncharacterized protein